MTSTPVAWGRVSAITFLIEERTGKSSLTGCLPTGFAQEQPLAQKLGELHKKAYLAGQLPRQEGGAAVPKSKKAIETWDDVRRAFDQIPKEHIDCRLWHRLVTERYEDGRLTFHAHLYGAWVNRPWSQCLEISANASAPLMPKNHVPVGDDQFSKFAGECRTQKQSPVFIRLYKTVEGVEVLMPAVIRLNTLENGNRFCGDTERRQVFRHAVGFGEFDVARSHRKGDSSLFGLGEWPGAILNNQFPSNVIQSGSDVRDAIAYDTAPCRGRLSGDPDPCMHVVVAQPERSVVRFAIDVATDLVLEKIQVLLSPDDFEPGTV